MSPPPFGPLPLPRPFSPRGSAQAWGPGHPTSWLPLRGIRAAFTRGLAHQTNSSAACAKPDNKHHLSARAKPGNQRHLCTSAQLQKLATASTACAKPGKQHHLCSPAERQKLEQEYLIKQGVDLGGISLMLHVRPCEGLVRQVPGVGWGGVGGGLVPGVAQVLWGGFTRACVLGWGPL